MEKKEVCFVVRKAENGFILKEVKRDDDGGPIDHVAYDAWALRDLFADLVGKWWPEKKPEDHPSRTMEKQEREQPGVPPRPGVPSRRVI